MSQHLSYASLLLECQRYCVNAALLTLQQPAPGAARPARTAAVAQPCSNEWASPCGLPAPWQQPSGSCWVFHLVMQQGALSAASAQPLCCQLVKSSVLRCSTGKQQKRAALIRNHEGNQSSPLRKQWCRERREREGAPFHKSISSTPPGDQLIVFFFNLSTLSPSPLTEE